MNEKVKNGRKRARERLLEALPNDSLAFIPAQVQIMRNGDTHYPFRQSSDYLYLTGIKEEGGCLFLHKDHDGNTTEILVVLDRDPLREQWNGFRLGTKGAAEATGIDKCFSTEQWSKVAKEIPQWEEALFFISKKTPNAWERANGIICELSDSTPWSKEHMETDGEFRIALRDLDPHLHAQRTIKEDWEIDLLKHSCEIAAQTHKDVMGLVRPEMFEYGLEAEYLRGFHGRGAESLAYPMIVGGGSNACVLHYSTNRDQLRNGDLVLVDAGCEYEGYASDITRTFPVNGTFSPEQKVIYDIVLESQRRTIEKCRPGVTHEELHLTSVRAIVEGLIDIGICKESVEECIDKRSYLKYYMHRVGHFLGLDVHDCGEYQEPTGTSRKMSAGMVLTVEPGCYFMPGLDGVDSKWEGIGVRIEDDVLFTAKGCQVLTDTAPRTTEAIEALQQS